MRYLSLEEFKDRIAQIVHPGQSAGMAKKTNPFLVRKPTDRGYNPPSSRDCGTGRGKTKRNHKK